MTQKSILFFVFFVILSAVAVLLFKTEFLIFGGIAISLAFFCEIIFAFLTPQIFFSLIFPAVFVSLDLAIFREFYFSPVLILPTILIFLPPAAATKKEIKMHFFTPARRAFRKFFGGLALSVALFAPSFLSGFWENLNSISAVIDKIPTQNFSEKISEKFGEIQKQSGEKVFGEMLKSCDGENFCEELLEKNWEKISSEN